jgi:hypothetical protein
MDKIRLTIGTRRTLQSGQPDDNLRPVEFVGEELGSFTAYHGDNDTRGVTETLYETEDGRLVVHSADWTKWQGETSSYSIQEVEEEDLGPGGRFERLGFEAGYQDALSLDDALLKAG